MYQGYQQWGANNTASTAGMTPEQIQQQQQYWQQYYQQWGGMQSQAQPPPPPTAGINPAPPVEPPSEEKPPLPPDPPPEEKESSLKPKDEFEQSKLTALQQQAAQWQQQKEWQKYQESLAQYHQQMQMMQQPGADNQKAMQDLQKEEQEFEKQFADWMKQYTDWKEQNKNHPNKDQYNQYEQQWKQYEVQMLQKREELQKRKQTLQSQSSSTGGYNNQSSQGDQQQNTWSSEPQTYERQNNYQGNQQDYGSGQHFGGPNNRGRGGGGPRGRFPGPNQNRFGGPNQHQDHQGPRQRFGGPNQGPRQRFDSSNQGPRQRFDQPNQGPRHRFDNPNQAPRQRFDNPNQAPRQRFDNSNQGPRASDPNTQQQWNKQSPNQGDAKSAPPSLMDLKVGKPQESERQEEDADIEEVQMDLGDDSEQGQPQATIGRGRISHRGRGSHDQSERGRGRGFGDSQRGRGFGDRDSQRGRGFGDRERGRGFGDSGRGRGFGDGQRGRGFGDGPRGRGFEETQRGRGFGQSHRGREGAMGRGRGRGSSLGPYDDDHTSEDIHSDYLSDYRHERYEERGRGGFRGRGGLGRGGYEEGFSQDLAFRGRGGRGRMLPGAGRERRPSIEQDNPGIGESDDKATGDGLALSTRDLEMIKQTAQELKVIQDQQAKLKQLAQLEEMAKQEESLIDERLPQEEEFHPERRPIQGEDFHPERRPIQGEDFHPERRPFPGPREEEDFHPKGRPFPGPRDEFDFREGRRMLPPPRDEFLGRRRFLDDPFDPLEERLRRKERELFRLDPFRDPYDPYGRLPPPPPSRDLYDLYPPPPPMAARFGRTLLAPASEPVATGQPKVIDYGHGAEKKEEETENKDVDYRRDQMPEIDFRDEFPRREEEQFRQGEPDFGERGMFSDRDQGRERERDRDRGRDRSPVFRDRNPRFERDYGESRFDRDRGRDWERDRRDLGREDRYGRNGNGDGGGRDEFRSFGPSDYNTNREHYNHHRPSEVPPKAETVLIDRLLSKQTRATRPEHIVVILRGIPGSGKTYVAKLLKEKEIANGGVTPRILSLDDYFMQEVEKVERDPDTGKQMKKTVLEYEYEPQMENSYRQSLLKSFKKQIDNCLFSFMILDAVFDKVKHFEEFWSYAKSKGFQVYTSELQVDLNICAKRNVHNRSHKDIKKILDGWEPTPRHYITLDIRSLLQEDSITEVEMEDSADGDEKEKKIEEIPERAEEVESGLMKSKWEIDTSNQTLDKLDGMRMRRKSDQSPQGIEDFLQLSDDYESRVSEPGKKRVRWADIEERKAQVRQREIGFVVGQTNWDRMTDDNYADKALNRTKYI